MTSKIWGKKKNSTDHQQPSPFPPRREAGRERGQEIYKYHSISPTSFLFSSRHFCAPPPPPPSPTSFFIVPLPLFLHVSGRGRASQFDATCSASQSAPFSLYSALLKLPPSYPSLVAHRAAPRHASLPGSPASLTVRGLPNGRMRWISVSIRP